LWPVGAGVLVRIDWNKRAEYIRSQHAIGPTWANEAVQDDHSVWLALDPASRSGHSVRVIGYSTSAKQVLTVILVGADSDASEEPDGDWWGAKLWVANDRDRHFYGEENS
jgi:hypothetical protein